MSRKSKSEKFLEMKEHVIELLESIQEEVDLLTEAGMEDENAQVHNQLATIIEDAMAIDTMEGLEEVIMQGKRIEHNVEVWLAHHGRTSMELDWPQI